MRDDYSSLLSCHFVVLFFLPQGRKLTAVGNFKYNLEKKHFLNCASLPQNVYMWWQIGAGGCNSGLQQN